jgi:hypothetical protein
MAFAGLVDDRADDKALGKDVAELDWAANEKAPAGDMPLFNPPQ